MLSLRTLTQKERDVLLEGAQKTWLRKARSGIRIFFASKTRAAKRKKREDRMFVQPDYVWSLLWWLQVFGALHASMHQLKVLNF